MRWLVLALLLLTDAAHASTNGVLFGNVSIVNGSSQTAAQQSLGLYPNPSGCIGSDGQNLYLQDRPQTKSVSSYTVQASDGCSVLNFTVPAAISLSSPIVTGFSYGFGVKFTNASTSGNLVITVPAPYTIGGVGQTFTIYPKQTCELDSDGASNYVLTACYILSYTTGVSAAGTNLATATALTTDINVVTTVASGTGVKLLPNLGDRQEVYNRGANSLTIYPNASTVAIESNAAGAGVILAAAAHATFFCTSTTQCYQAP